LSAKRFVNYYCRSGARLQRNYFVENDYIELFGHLLNQTDTSASSFLDRAALAHQGRPQWVSLADEIGKLDAAQAIEATGLPTSAIPEFSIRLSYDIETSLLHVPTVLDAVFNPFFVSKPS
jgi:hypothetical protein